MINLDGIYVNFPDYQVQTDTELGKQPLGHAMVIAVDPTSGKTRGSEYGRYENDGKIKGKARRVRVPDFKMAKAGSPTQEELDAYAKALDKAYGHSGGRTQVYYLKDADYNSLVEKMKSAESADEKNGYYQNKPYSILNHNCGTYAADMLKDSMPMWARAKINATSGSINPFTGWNTFGTPSMSAPKSLLVKRAEYDNPKIDNPGLIKQVIGAIYK